MCAVIKQGILGGLSGSLGSVTGSSWKGIAVLKAKPLSVANPKTALQVAQRDKMSWLVEFFKSVLSTIVKPLNDRFAAKMSGFNLVVQQSMGAFDNSGVINDFAKLFITPSSKGEQEIFINEPVADGDLNIVFDWTANLSGTQLNTDKLYAVVYNETQGTFVTSSGTKLRSAASATIVVPATFFVLADVIHVYAAFLKQDGTVVYKQSYKTTVVDS
jgi:hypothetical protein